LSNKNNNYNAFTSRYDFGERNNEKKFHFTVLDLEIYQIINNEI